MHNWVTGMGSGLLFLQRVVNDQLDGIFTAVSFILQELTEAAYSLYREMVTVTLDVDEFAYWASNFVPNGYHAKHAFGKCLYPVLLPISRFAFLFESIQTYP